MNEKVYSLSEIEKKMLEVRGRVQRYENAAWKVLKAQEEVQNDSPKPDGLGRIFI